MSKEVRCVMFSREEVCAAAADFLAKRMPKLLAYEIGKIEFIEAGGATTARISFSRETQREQVTLNGSELMEAILRLCHRMHIPLSNRSSKKLENNNGNLVLVMSMNLDFARPTIQDGAVVHTAPEDKAFVDASRNAATQH